MPPAQDPSAQHKQQRNPLQLGAPPPESPSLSAIEKQIVETKRKIAEREEQRRLSASTTNPSPTGNLSPAEPEMAAKKAEAKRKIEETRERLRLKRERERKSSPVPRIM